MTDRTSALQSSLQGYQRHRPAIDNLVISTFMGVVLFRVWMASAVFGVEWAVVIALAAVALGIQNRAWGYYALVAGLVIPFWILSPYLSVLFLAAATLAHRWVIQRLTLVLLVASAPVLAEWHVPAMPALLVGLAAGPFAGFVTGAASALWMKLLAGLAGLPAELSLLHGARVSWDSIAAHTQAQSGLALLSMPWAFLFDGRNAPLLHALQCLGWGAAGWLVGAVRRTLWMKGPPRFGLVPPLATGALAIWLTLFILPVPLQNVSLWRIVEANRVTAGIALASISAAFLCTLIERSRRALAPHAARPGYTRRRTREGMILIPTNPEATVVTTMGRRRALAPLAPTDEDEGVIMLEID